MPGRHKNHFKVFRFRSEGRLVCQIRFYPSLQTLQLSEKSLGFSEIGLIFPCSDSKSRAFSQSASFTCGPQSQIGGQVMVIQP